MNPSSSLFYLQSPAAPGNVQTLFYRHFLSGSGQRGGSRIPFPQFHIKEAEEKHVDLIFKEGLGFVSEHWSSCGTVSSFLQVNKHTFHSWIPAVNFLLSTVVLVHSFRRKYIYE